MAYTKSKEAINATIKEFIDNADKLVSEDKRTSSGYEKPIVEVYGKASDFQPARDRVLVKRLASIRGTDLIARPDVAVELSERGYVVAVGDCIGAPPVGSIATFGKYGAEEKRFDDDSGPNTYAMIWIDDIRGWHA